MTTVQAERIAVCLMCERTNPPCGWEQPFLFQRDYDPVARAEQIRSVCQDCVDRRLVGGD